MKKVFFTAMVAIVFSSISFAVTKEVKKKEVLKMQVYKVYCGNVYGGSFSCDGCDALAVAHAICGY